MSVSGFHAGCKFAVALLVFAIGPVILCAQQPQEVANRFSALEESLQSQSDWQRWREFIVPNQDDLKWKQTPWLPTFREGIIQAAEQDRPVLLWTMNGHPLGCT